MCMLDCCWFLQFLWHVFILKKQAAELLSNYTLCCKQQLVSGILWVETKLCGDKYVGGTKLMWLENNVRYLVVVS